jgi:hypothetical protein
MVTVKYATRTRHQRGCIPNTHTHDKVCINIAPQHTLKTSTIFCICESLIDSNEHRVLAVDHSLGFLGHDLCLGHSEDAAHGGHNFSELLKTVRRKCESRVRV